MLIICRQKHSSENIIWKCFSRNISFIWIVGSEVWYGWHQTLVLPINKDDHPSQTKKILAAESIGEIRYEPFYVHLCNSSCNYLVSLVKFPFPLKSSIMVVELAQ